MGRKFIDGIVSVTVALAICVAGGAFCFCLGQLVTWELRSANRNLRQENAELRAKLDWWECANREPEQPAPPTPLDDMPNEERFECVDSLPTYGATPNADGTFADPHDDPKWHATRRQTAIKIPHCQVKGCTDPPKGDAIHHGISARYCVMAGHYELAVANGPGQTFYRLCEKHHGPIGHGIGNGGAWTKFNVDIDADIAAGRWNSRGKSEWPFADDADAVAWVKSRIKHSKTAQAP